MIKLTDVANQKLLDAFLAQVDNQQLYQRVLASPDDTQGIDELHRRFQEFYAELRLTKYISSIIHYTAIELAVRNRKLGNVCKPMDDMEKVADGVMSTVNDSDQDDMGEWKDVLSDKRVLDAIHQLTEKEQKVITLLYLKNLRESGAANLLGISQQAVSKAKKRALEKLRDQLALEG
ncbi:sigma-70 family RNA polymerase sigma factor [Brevibacillus sp. 179-C9.3 HS]|uniref:sigma-70 family RNA polymerase sigma factor n=1 Tax=unclassified Brevibacillus TaxID=2684853 RepID=UPI00399F0144